VTAPTSSPPLPISSIHKCGSLYLPSSSSPSYICHGVGPLGPHVSRSSSKVCHDSFCQLGNSVSLPWVVYYGAFYLHVVSSFSCIFFYLFIEAQSHVTIWGVEVWLHLFLFLSVVGSEWLASWPFRFTWRNGPALPFNGGMVGPKTGFGRPGEQRNIRGVSKKFGEWSDISMATWARCARMHMAIQRYIEKRHLA